MSRFRPIHLVFLLFSLTTYADENPLSSKIPSNDPEKLVRAFCRADGDGMLESSTYWPLAKKYTVWKDGPGWDAAYAVASFTTETKTRSKTAAEVEVTYNVIGSLEATSEEGVQKLDASKGGVERVVYHLARKQGRWKILAPQNPPHVSAAFAISQFSSHCGKPDCKDDPSLAILKQATQKPDYSFSPSP